MLYRRQLKSGIVITSTQAEHAKQLADLQPIFYPTLDPSELFREEHYYHHIKIFPDGQFVALDGERVVGATVTMRLKFDFDHPDHTFGELIAGGWLTPHDPEGNWMYGLDIGTHPDYRQRGIARGLYYARQETVRRLGLTGQLAGGMMIGYGKYKDQMSGEEYFAKMKAGEIYDPTVSTQMRVGFEPAVLIPNYINDPTCGGYGVLIRLLASQEVESE